MHSLVTILLVLSTVALQAHGANLSLPGKKSPLGKRNHRIPRTLQEPTWKKRDADTSPFEKKDTLFERQLTCGAGTVACTGGGCCEGACCGDGCCPAGYNCRFVGNTPGCCPIGTTCSNTISGCTNAGYVECSGYDFCCPPGQACSLDASNNAQCGGVNIGGSGNSNNSDVGSNPTTTPSTGNANTSLNFGVTTTTPVVTFNTRTTANAAPTTTKGTSGNTGSFGNNNGPTNGGIRLGGTEVRLGALMMLVGGVVAL